MFENAFRNVTRERPPRPRLFGTGPFFDGAPTPPLQGREHARLNSFTKGKTSQVSRPADRKDDPPHGDLDPVDRKDDPPHGDLDPADHDLESQHVDFVWSRVNFDWSHLDRLIGS